MIDRIPPIILLPEPFSLWVAGTPRPQPRPRPGKHGRMVSTMDPKARLWRQAIVNAARGVTEGRSLPLFARTPLRLSCTFLFLPPATAPERIGQPHDQKPDASNLLKLVEDALEDARVFDNDCRIFKPSPEKWWADRAGVQIIVEAQAPAPARQLGPVVNRPDWL